MVLRKRLTSDKDPVTVYLEVTRMILRAQNSDLLIVYFECLSLLGYTSWIETIN